MDSSCDSLAVTEDALPASYRRYVDMDFDEFHDEYVFSNGDVYMGDLVDGKMHGIGIYRSSSGEIYKGEFFEHMRDGSGFYECDSGTYEGIFQNDKFHRFGIITYKKGDSYRGDFAEGMLHGIGTYTFQDDSFYRGNFEYNTIDGFGFYKYSSGTIYKGVFSNGQPHGLGKLFTPTGIIYEGDVDNGLAHGEGSVLYSDGALFIGSFEYGQRHGNGVFKSDGRKIEGVWFDDELSGDGEYTADSNSDPVEVKWQKNLCVMRRTDELGFASCQDSHKEESVAATSSTVEKSESLFAQQHAVEENLIMSKLNTPSIKKLLKLMNSEDIFNFSPTSHEKVDFGKFLMAPDMYWDDDKKTENATIRKFTLPDGNVYEGMTHNNRPEGLGCLSYTSGTVCQGEWSDGFPDGPIRYDYADGSTFIGICNAGLRDGFGIFCTSSLTYRGMWKNNLPNGSGKLIDKVNGFTHIGTWSNGRREGKGLCMYKNGTVYNGEWDNSIQCGKGKMIYADGSMYDGEWSKGKGHGRGYYIDAKGTVYEGQWSEGRRHGEGMHVDAHKSIYEGCWLDDLQHGFGKLSLAHGGEFTGNWKCGIAHGRGQFTLHDMELEGLWSHGVCQPISPRTHDSIGTHQNVSGTMESLNSKEIKPPESNSLVTSELEEAETKWKSFVVLNYWMPTEVMGSGTHQIRFLTTDIVKPEGLDDAFQPISHIFNQTRDTPHPCSPLPCVPLGQDEPQLMMYEQVVYQTVYIIKEKPVIIYVNRNRHCLLGR